MTLWTLGGDARRTWSRQELIRLARRMVPSVRHRRAKPNNGVNRAACARTHLNIADDREDESNGRQYGNRANPIHCFIVLTHCVGVPRSSRTAVACNLCLLTSGKLMKRAAAERPPEAGSVGGRAWRRSQRHQRFAQRITACGVSWRGRASQLAPFSTVLGTWLTAPPVGTQAALTMTSSALHMAGLTTPPSVAERTTRN
jgi:hypothetical protein